MTTEKSDSHGSPERRRPGQAAFRGTRFSGPPGDLPSPAALPQASRGPDEHADHPGERLFMALLDLLPDHFYVADSDLRLVYVNKPLSDYYGLSNEQLVGKTFTEVGHNKDFARRFADLGRQILEADTPRVTEPAPYPEPDGTLTYLRRFDIPFRHPETGDRMVMGLVQDRTAEVERVVHERRAAELHREMQIAQEIQRSLLPRELRTGWVELFGFSEPAAYAGGDFYDWQQLPDGSIVLALGDATGHGVGPALDAAECRAYWRVLAPSLPLRDAVLRLNELIVNDLSEGRFVTFAAAKFSPDGSVEIFSAGQGPLLLRRGDGSVEILDTHMFPLGVMSDAATGVETTRLRLAPGDTVLVVSDGITEARNAQ
ncbi:MAG: PAS domain S-box protein, partial [Leptolyngbya sp. PLA3]